ncbi:GNAT family N-acetyltransferase [Puia sp. P3]|uniref:GNAT family N-acetyltransferase n=1 Tax=Puia sp. P3 TaxID=3423952 RepID=UPI003D66A5CB
MREVIVAYEEGALVGCGAIRAFTNEATEVKRMYVRPDRRGLGIASTILAAPRRMGKRTRLSKDRA